MRKLPIGRIFIVSGSSVLLMTSAFLSTAAAHKAKSGWTYPIDCCSDYDCREVSADLISERPGGYLIELNGEKITYSDSRIRHSPDGVYHWCSQNGRDDTRTICLFVPPNSF